MILDASDHPHKKALGVPRIVSLVPSITELLFDLGLKESVVGRTPFCIHPQNEISSVKRVGGTKTVNVEKILSVNPTHVILNIDENKSELFEALKGHEVEIIVTHPAKPEDNLALFDLLAYVFSCEERASHLASEFKKKLRTLRTKSSQFEHRKVLYLIWREPWMTISSETYISKMLNLINWESVPSQTEKRYPALSSDDLSLLDFDLCLLSSEPYPFKEKHIAEIHDASGDCRPTFLVDGEKLSWYGSRALKGIDYLLELSETRMC